MGRHGIKSILIGHTELGQAGSHAGGRIARRRVPVTAPRRWPPQRLRRPRKRRGRLIARRRRLKDSLERRRLCARVACKRRQRRQLVDGELLRRSG
eukprot:1406814-Pleurochrysis_carterae.AAC.7